jgi:hypothetical protein
MNDRKAAIEMAAHHLREEIFKEAAVAIKGEFFRGLKIGLTIGSICSILIMTLGVILWN